MGYREGWYRGPAALALYVALILAWMGAYESADRRLLDAASALTQHQVRTDLLLIEIDATSLQRIQRWPWPRRYHAELLEKLREAGVADVFYDVDFSSASSHADDQELTRVLASFSDGQVMLPAFLQAGNSLGMGGIVTSLPLTIFRQHSALASVNLQPDSDGLVRRISGSRLLDGQLVPLAGVHMARRFDQLKNQLSIDYSIDPASFQRISFSDVLEGKYDPSQLRNKHIMVGATAIELGDMLPVPVYQSLPGVVVQALSYQTLREGGLWKLPFWVEVTLAIALALFMGMAFKRSSCRNALALIALVTVSLGGFALYALRQWHLIVPFTTLVTQMALGCGFFLLLTWKEQQRRMRAQARDLRRKDALMASVVDHSIDAIFTLTDDGIITSVNPAATHLVGSPNIRLVGEKLNALIDGFKLPTNPDFSAGPPIADRGNETAEGRCLRADGTYFPVEIATSPMQVDQETIHTVFVRDITERIRQRAALEHQATHDALTGLANRYFLNTGLQKLLQAWQPGQPSIGLLLIDLDKFKEINDALGHQLGDQMLIQIAHRFTGCVSSSMTLARIGGDEFAVLIPEADVALAVESARHLLRCFELPFNVQQMALEIRASIGIAFYPDDAENANVLLQNADTAMYVAKRLGSSIMLYQPEFTQRSALRMVISTGLRTAISEAQLMMYYQPKLDLASHQVVGLEALLRWRHPELGFIMPDDIIDVAENTGLIWPLTEWTLKTALREAKMLRNKGYAVPVAVNLSARLLQDSTLLDHIEHCLSECETDPQWLTLEITESAIMIDPDRALKTAHALQAAGVDLSIDDFGTGYSSLSYLRKLPAVELKIDKSFVTDMLREGNDVLIVRSTIDLAHNLGLRVVAEGAETEAMLNALRAMGCDTAQGFHIGHPVPIAEIEQWMAAHFERRKTLQPYEQSDLRLCAYPYN